MEKFIVGITSCPTGVAHTFMAAKAIEKAAGELGYQVKIETQGSGGVKNALSAEDIARADAVIVAADIAVDLSRFVGKPVLQTNTKTAIHDGKKLCEESFGAPLLQSSLAKNVSQIKADRAENRTGFYRHLMTGVSYMLPIVVAGGLLIALSFAFGGIYAGEKEGTFGWVLMKIGGGAAFALFVPVLGAYIAFSIAGRVGLTPGIVGGLLAANIGAGFLGAIVAGFLAGYFVKFLNDVIKLPENLDSLKPTLILPLISTLGVGLAMMYLIGPPVKYVLEVLTAWLTNLQSTSAAFLGLILGLMMAFDMGGPVNKAAYTFSVGLLSSQVYEPMAAAMAAGITPPLGIALATLLFKNRFTRDEVEAGKAAFVLGISFITEGAIPYASRDPFRVIPSIMVGSAVAGALSMVLNVGLLAPHGGIFVLAIPQAVTNLLYYAIAIIAGTLVTTGMLFLLKRPIEK